VGAALTLLLRRRLRLAFGVVYVGLAAVALLWLRDAPGVGRGNILFLVLVVWGSDIGAYAAGRLIGGRRLAPAISPGKTWSGAVGGLLVGMAAGWLGVIALVGAPAWLALPVAAMLSVVSQTGDLFESWLKRGFGVKDSSHLIPGHGGLFDRLDGLLTAAPMAGLLALWLGRGVGLWQ
jgi:phosphatidate cytidylyltransferase